MTARRGILRLALGAAVLLVVLLGVDPAAVAGRIGGTDLALAVPAIIGLTAVHLVPAAAWRAILATAGLRLPWRSALSLFYAAQAVGGITPANLGGEIHRAATLRSWGQGWRIAIAPLVIQRVTSYLGLCVLAAGSLALVASRARVAGSLVAAGVAFAVGIALIAWIVVRPPRPLRGVHRRLVALLGVAEEGTGPELHGAVWIGSIAGLVFHAGGIALTWLLMIAVDPAAATPLVPAALAIARLSLALPLTPSGIGFQEGVLALLFSALGLDPGSALAGMLLARLALVLTTATGVALLLRPPAAVRAPGAPAPSVPPTRAG